MRAVVHFRQPMIRHILQPRLIKRRDEQAAPGSDIAAERPESVQSGVTLAELLDS